MTTAHLGDCLNGCQICADNHHEGMTKDCPDCGFQPSISWGELAELTHQTQVERFNFCPCEDMSDTDGESPFQDCPRIEQISYYTTCENCEEEGNGETELEGIGQYDRDSNTLFTLPCPKCGEESEISGWLDEEEEE